MATGDSGLELREVDEPQPGPDQALVSVRAVSVNRGEARALHSAAPGWIPGSDVAGVVDAPAADGSGRPAGTPVLGLVPAGGWAERVAVSTRLMASLPDGLDHTSAATLPVAGLTALRALHAAKLLNDHRVLITGAAGGVGRFAVQLAAHDGAEVTAVVGRPERGEGLQRLGARNVVVGMPEEGEFDVILESAGGASLAAALGMVARCGTIVSFGNSSGEKTTFDARQFFARCGAHLYAFSLFPELERLGTGALDLSHLAEQAAGGRLQLTVGLQASWRDASRAVRAVLDRQVQGKAVLEVA